MVLNKKINVLILDDHPLVCAAIKNLIAPIDYIDTVLTISDVRKAFKIIKSLNIDLLILDINLGDNDGFDFYRRIKAHGYNGKILFISANDNQLYSDTAFKLGADGYICKSEDMDLIKESLDGIMKGYTFFKFKSSDEGCNKKVALSNRETVVFNYLIKGKTNTEIAEILSLSTKTVSTYKRRIFDKYQVDNIVDLIKLDNWRLY